MKYTHKDFTFVTQNSRSSLYRSGKLLFIGNSWTGLNLFIQYSNNAPEVKEMFKAQLEQREVIKLRAEQKKSKVPDTPIKEEPKTKKPVIRRPGRDIGRIIR